MSTAETLDLSTLPSAPLVDVDFDAIFAARLALMETYWTAARAVNPSLPPLDVLMLKSEPGVILTEAFSAFEMVILQAINDAGKALRLAQASGGDLEHLAATYHRTVKQLVRPATETTAAIYESDEDLRTRAQLAPEALSDMGLTPGGYVYKIRTAFADRIKHVYPIHRGNGRVEIRVLGRDGDGTVSGTVLAEIVAAFSIEEGSQSTDVLTVLSAEIVPVVWDVTLVLRRGPDANAVKALARKGMEALAGSLHRINATHYREAIATAAHVGPVITVRANSPTDDVMGRPEAAPFVTAINVQTEVL